MLRLAVGLIALVILGVLALVVPEEFHIRVTTKRLERICYYAFIVIIVVVAVIGLTGCGPLSGFDQ